MTEGDGEYPWSFPYKRPRDTGSQNVGAHLTYKVLDTRIKYGYDGENPGMTENPHPSLLLPLYFLSEHPLTPAQRRGKDSVFQQSFITGFQYDTFGLYSKDGGPVPWY
jgi:hypothetical protein